jgi:hypothetical protein
MRGRARCRLHGGKATGPRTPEGRARISQAHLKHGRYSRAAQAAVVAARFENTDVERARALRRFARADRACGRKATRDSREFTRACRRWGL